MKYPLLSSLNFRRRSLLSASRFRIFFCLLLLFVGGILLPASAQVRTWDQVIEEWMEEMESDEEEGGDAWALLYEELCEWHEHPLEVNSATREELSRFPFLSAAQVEELQAYLYSYGPMRSLGELKLVTGWDEATIERFSFFIYIGEQQESRRRFPSLRSLAKYGKHELITRLDVPLYTRAGFQNYPDSILEKYPNRKYLGDKYAHSVRYQYHYADRLYLGWTGEKDAGEPFFARERKGYDFNSFYLLLKEVGALKSLALGNYRLSFGQGLVMNQDFSLGKNTSISNVGKYGGGVKKHSSSSESNYLQGVATAIRLGHFTATGFYARQRQDANLSTDSTAVDSLFITSLKTDGYHRTPLEDSKKNNIRNTLYGCNIAFERNAIHIGATAVHNFFNLPLNPSSAAYKTYYPRGRAFEAYSVDYSCTRYRWALAGEAAYSRGGGTAFLQSFRYRLSSDWQLMALFRAYSKDYTALYASAFSEASGVRNETGAYLALEGALLRRVTWSGYVDWFYFPFLRYQISQKGSRGLEVSNTLEWAPDRRWNLSLRYRYKNKGKDFTLSEQKGVGTLTQQRVRLQLRYAPMETLLLKTTLEGSQVGFITKESPDRGWLVAQTVGYAPSFVPGTIDLTAAYFHTDSYDSRQSLYEKGLLNTFAFSSFYGRGLRAAVQTRWNLGAHWMFIAKYGLTRYADRESIGSSQQLINGHLKRDWQFQLRMKF
jgi:hypothetical protein